MSNGVSVAPCLNRRLKDIFRNLQEIQMAAMLLGLITALAHWLHGLEHSVEGEFLGPAPHLSKLEADALLAARLAFASQPWL